MNVRTTRLINAALTTITLAVPASALALSGVVSDTQAAAQTPLHVWAPRRVSVARMVTVRGQAPATEAGHRAVLETYGRRSNNWNPVAVATIGPRGGFAIRARLRQSGLIRVADAGGTPVASGGRFQNQAVATGLVSVPQPVAVAAQFRVAAPARNVLGGRSMIVRGHLYPARAGRTVRVQGRFGRTWKTLGGGRTGRRGGFAVRISAVSGLERRLRAVFGGDTANARTTHSAGNVTVYGLSVASWYNDAGNTACGYHAGYGVANRTLPCGTKVRIRYGSRAVTATVDDRGPFVGGRDWDLNQNTAGALGFGGVGTIWVSQ